MNHPLTDEMCKQIAPLDHPSDIRSAADWQLEQDANYFAQYLIKHFGFAPDIAYLRAEWFKKEMRPQEDNK